MKKSFILCIVLMAVIASCSKKSAPTTGTAAKVDVATIVDKNCKCHGPDGISGKAPNLAKSNMDKDGLIKIINKGEGHMPGFEDVLSQREVSALADWILTLKKG